MSSELLVTEGDPPGARNGHVTPARPVRRWSRPRRTHGPINRWWIRAHRWASLVLGLLFILEATTGAVPLYGNDLARALHPERHAVTPSATPMSEIEALRMVWATHPQDWLTTPLPGVFGADMTLGYYLLGVLGVLLIFLCLSGAIIWWPGVRALASGFAVRRGRGHYVRDLDLHRLVGIVAVPFLLMWGVTGAAFYFHWPAQAYFALLPGEAHEDPPPPTPGTGPMLSLEQAQAVALAAHPGAQVAGISEIHPERPDGSYGFRLYQGYDPYHHWNYAGSRYVGVDSHGGGIQDYAPERPGAPLTERLWDDGFYYGLHFGSAVSGLPRVIWLLFGLTPVLLGITGTTVWLTK
ncbi:MAG TPA: PepSY-associated TM helix domain-containing protein [Pseudonocardia sp.]|uniref:PepSY-associated TM helix domain-containing protein n=1 Tax=Pseudonocardia sp. TaxID=60912 RepID=UPI002B551227|nr:PepSY-associated TM helix domain-containing protein [Pseudonocardia sp.]HTF54518.1 PepSY-associated TM helix domain-containing protein [Pseudonocardia sp.]